MISSRFAGTKPRTARIALGLLLLVLAATLLAFAGPASLPSAGGHADVASEETIVQGVRGDGDYYSVAARASRTSEHRTPSLTTFPLATLAVVQAALPRTVTLLLLYALAAGVMVAWYARVAPAFARAPARFVVLVLIAGGLIAFVQGELVAVHEAWGGLLVALSLAVRRADRWVEAVAIGLVAMLSAETAALYVGIMAVLAFAEGNRREAFGWAATLAVFALVVALHVHAVAQTVRPTDPAATGWIGMAGFGFFVATMQASTALDFAPAWLAAPLVGLAAFGWAAWNTPLASRTVAILVAYAGSIGLFGRGDSVHWGLMIAPLLLTGLAFVPDGLRDLVAAARTPRRQIVVTRVVR